MPSHQPTQEHAIMYASSNRKMTYSNLMAKQDEGDIEIMAWADDGNEVVAQVTFFNTGRTQNIEVTKVPADIRS